jgi:hypothetical protein
VRATWDIGCARATCCACEVIYFLCTLNGIIVLVVESVTDNQPQLTKLDSKENDRRSRDVRLEKPKVWALLIGQWSIYSLGNCYVYCK